MRKGRQIQVLKYVIDNPGCQISDIPGKYIAASRALVTLHDRGWVEVRTHPEDRRVKQYYPTERGIRALQLIAELEELKQVS